jgi:16S rRNA (uracil1498-N3)-methyltransferase
MGVHGFRCSDLRLIYLLIAVSTLSELAAAFVQSFGPARSQIDFSISHSTSLLLAKEDPAAANLYTTLPRLYVGENDSRLASGTLMTLTREQSHYLITVLRLGGKKRNQLRLFDGETGEWLGQITNERKAVQIECLQQIRTQPPRNEGPWLYFCPLKNKTRQKWMMEKCTELGVSVMIPLQSQRTEACYQTDHLSAQLVEASEQCERMDVPELRKDVESLSMALQSWDSSTRQLLICRERDAMASSLWTMLKKLTSHPIAIVIGPEGGWSPEELDLIDKYCRNEDSIHTVSLGSNILRAETAAMAALSGYMLFRDAAKGK